MNTSESPTRRKWREIIGRQEHSGLGVGKFCRNNLIALSSFYNWRRKLARGQAAGFVEATVAAVPVRSAIELRLGGGRRLLLRRGFDRDLLAEVLAALEVI